MSKAGEMVMRSKIYYRFVKIPRGPKTVLKDVIFLPKKSKFSSEMLFFPKKLRGANPTPTP